MVKNDQYGRLVIGRPWKAGSCISSPKK